jgi:hypothetical protein
VKSLIAVLLIADGAFVAAAQPDKLAAGRAAFIEVASVLQSPRCMTATPPATARCRRRQPRPRAEHLAPVSALSGTNDHRVGHRGPS